MLVEAAQEAVNRLGFPGVRYRLLKLENGATKLDPPLPSGEQWTQRYKEAYGLLDAEAKFLRKNLGFRKEFLVVAEQALAQGADEVMVRKLFLAMQKTKA